MVWFCIVLLIYMLIREVFYAQQINKLTDRVMSKSFYEYQQAKALTIPEKRAKKIKEPINFDEDIDLAEDLSAIL